MNAFLGNVLIVLVVRIFQKSICLQLTEEYCTSERFNARCSTFEILLVRRALYGRLAAGRCITAEYAHAIGCYSDVTNYVDAVCSGKNNCSLLVASLDSIAQPCAKDFKSYLEVSYECAKASFLDDCTSHNETKLDQKSGFLALFERTSNSSPYHIKSSCPWVIEVSRGQRINVTWQVTPATHSFSVDDGSSDNVNEDNSASLDDDNSEFSSFDNDRGSNDHGSNDHGLNDHGLNDHGSRASMMERISCPLQMTFTESGLSVVHILCRNETKDPRVVYLSKTNRLEIKVESLFTSQRSSSVWDFDAKEKLDVERSSAKSKSSNLWKPHVLHYDVFGCAYSQLPTSATITKHGDDVAIVCNDSLEVFYVTCVGNQWIGEIGNCTKSAFKMRPPTMVSHSTGDYRRGVALAVLTGIGLGMVAGSFMLLTICLLRRKRRSGAASSARQKSFKKHSRTSAETDINISMTQNSCLMHHHHHHHPCCASQEGNHFHRIKSDISRSNATGPSEETYWATKVNHSECSLYSVGTNDTITTPVNQWPAIIEDSKFCRSLCRSSRDEDLSPKRSDQQFVRHCPHLFRHSSKVMLESLENESDYASRHLDEESTNRRPKLKHFENVCSHPSETFDCQSSNQASSCLLSCH